MELRSLNWLNDHEMMDHVGSALNRLTPREEDILGGMLECLDNSEIARELRISRKTVDQYRTNLLTKVGVRSPTELVAWVLAYHFQTSDGTAALPVQSRSSRVSLR